MQILSFSFFSFCNFFLNRFHALTPFKIYLEIKWQKWGSAICIFPPDETICPKIAKEISIRFGSTDSFGEVFLEDKAVLAIFQLPK